MEYVIYQGQLEETYDLLHHGESYYIPFSVDNNKAHKILARQERNAQRWEWMMKHDWQTGIVIFLLVGAFVVWLGS
jgi:hypothetical protein